MNLWRIILLAAMLSSASVLNAERKPIDGKSRQILRDLCTLNIYLELQIRNAHGRSLAYRLVPKEIMDTPQTRYNVDAEELGEILMGKKYQTALHIFIDKLAGGGINSHMCNAYEIATGGWIQENLDRATMADLVPKIKAEFGVITFDIANNLNSAINRFAQLSYERNHKLVVDIASYGGELMDTYLENGFPSLSQVVTLEPEKFNLKQELATIRSVDIEDRNPFYWSHINAYITGTSYPNTPLVCKWHTTPLIQMNEFLQKALGHIEHGTFRNWWTEQMR